jgi:hypothetical protein
MTDKYLCCDMTHGGACTAQADPCAPVVGVELRDLTAAETQGWTLEPRITNASFPPGTDGYAYWSLAAPRMGLCLVAPNLADPMHGAPTEPVGCLQLSIGPGIGAAIAQYTIPVDPRWDAYQFCYGPQLDAGRAGSAIQFTPDGQLAVCASVNDLLDERVAPTPVSGSCCAPAIAFRPEDLSSVTTWTIGIGEEIPGVPPNQIYITVDGGLHAYPQWDAGDQAANVPSHCLTTYFNQPANCGSPPPAGSSFGEGTLPPGNPGCVTCSSDTQALRV